MQVSLSQFLGRFLIVLGAIVVVFSRWIVFPGLERLLGIETLVGREHVAYLPDGGYLFTNPGAMFGWIAGVAVVGMLIGVGGFLLSSSGKSRS